MNENERLIEKFYTGFKNSDSRAMIECYHADVEFSDPVFPYLKGNQAKAMWAMLTQRKAAPGERTFEKVRADEKTGSAHWEAKYLFPATGRPVHNKIDATFEFKDGKIVKHTDKFDFWKWSGMAMVPAGLLLGWNPILKMIIRRKVRKLLDEFIASHTEFQ